MPEPLYQETIGKATIKIREYGNVWIVEMDDDGKHYERTFSPSPYPERDPYSLAIAMYDNTIQAAARKYNTQPATLDKPEFTKGIKP